MKTIQLFKYFISICIINTGVLSCKMKYEMAYNLPEEMPAYVKESNLERCKTGYELYKKTCGKCHSTYEGKKEIVPNFSTAQMSTYQFRSSNRSHTDSLSDAFLSDEELTYVITFFTYQAGNQKINRKTKNKN